MALILNTNIINDTEGGHLLDAKNIKGGYLVVDTNPNEIIDHAVLPRDTIVAGTLCYCTKDSNFYQYIAHEDEEGNVTYTWEVRKMFDGQPDSELLGAHAAALGISTQAVGVAGFATGINTDARTRGAQAHGYSTQAGGLACKIIGQGEVGDGWGYYLLDGEYPSLNGFRYIVRLSSVSRTLIGEIGFTHSHDTDPTVPEGQTRVDVTYYDNKLTIENEAYDENNYSQYPSDYLIILPNDDSFDRVEIGNVEIGFNSFAAGDNNLALERASVAFGRENKSLGQYAFTEGYRNIANYAAHAEGHENKASGITSHAEGREGEASGYASHVEGIGNIASGVGAHAEGRQTSATGNYSHAAGLATSATSEAQTVIGAYNSDVPNAKLIVGAGSSSRRANCFATGNNGTEDYITIGETTLTETQLKKIIEFINRIENIEGGI